MSVLILPGTTTPAHVLTGDTFSAGTNYGASGTMPNNGAITITPSNVAQPIPAGYHNGSGQVLASSGTPTANGIQTSSTTLLPFTNDAGASVNRNYLQVTGLNFTPSRINLEIDYGTGTNVHEIVVYTANTLTDAGSRIVETNTLNGSSSPGTVFKLDGTNAYVNGTGFQLPVGWDGYSYKWYAYRD